VRGALEALRRVRLVAGLTFKEAVRQRFFNALLVIAVALVGASAFLGEFDFGGEGAVKFVVDFGFGALLLFGSVLAIVGTTQLFFNELESRTALTLLAKPIRRGEFLVGKFLGTAALTWMFAAVMAAVVAALVFWRHTSPGDGWSGAPAVDPRYADIAVYALLQALKFAVLGAMALCVASFAQTPLYTMLVSFVALVICQLQYIARDAYGGLESMLARAFVGLLALVFPNFQVFNLGEQLVLGDNAGLEAAALARVAGYALAYTAVFLGLAHLNFRRREV